MPVVALQSSPNIHPECERLLAVGCWTRDPAVLPLTAAMRTLVKVGEELRDLSAQRPAIDRLLADEIGSLMWDVAETGRVNVWHRELRATGIVSQICTELDSLRARWIAARLSSEGLSPTAPEIGPWYERLQALEDEAPTVTELWGDVVRNPAATKQDAP